MQVFFTSTCKFGDFGAGHSLDDELNNLESNWIVGLLQQIIFDYETKQGLKGKITDRQVKTVGLEIHLVAVSCFMQRRPGIRV